MAQILRLTRMHLLTIIIGYGHGGAVDLSQLGSTLRVKKFNLKVFIFLWCHVINDGDLNVLQRLGRRAQR